MSFSVFSNRELLAWPLLVGGLSLVVSIGCKRLKSAHPGSSDDVVTSSTPPFSTKEPVRYQALRVITTESPGEKAVSSTTAIARDGPNRRLETTLDSGKTVIYLATPQGRYLVLPSYEIFSTASAIELEQTQVVEDLSPQRLLSDELFEARYQHLGSENVLGRLTVKYKVTGIASHSETLIWIDESLGMPVRSETRSSDASSSTKTVMELRNLKLDVAPELFNLPVNYRKVSAAEALEKLGMMRQNAR